MIYYNRKKLKKIGKDGNEMKNSYEKHVKERMREKQNEVLLYGTFRGKAYNHIFKDLNDNFIDGSYPENKCLKGNLTDTKIKYHYAEHLNSSQTMCIAYFKKFFDEKKYERLLTEILEKEGLGVTRFDEITDAVFEYVPTPKEGTNFDFYLKFSGGKQITWEIKFTESEFGGIAKAANARIDYVKKFADVYKKMLRDSFYFSFPPITCANNQCLTSDVAADGCQSHADCLIYNFYKHYQINRNILYAKNADDCVVFLTPRENENLNEGRAYVEKLANGWNTKNIRNLYWEELLKTTLQVVSCEPQLYDYYTKFKAKYF